MKTSSAKAKARNLQKWVRDKILAYFPFLTDRDVKSTSMGASGEDILLSQAASTAFPYSVECKSRAKIAVYDMYEQAKTNSKGLEPLLIIKGNHKSPLAIIDADYFIKLISNK